MVVDLHNFSVRFLNICCMLNALRTLVLISLSFISITSCRPVKALGKNPKGDDLKRIEALPNYKNDAFQNLYQLPQAPPVVERKRRPGIFRLFRFLKGQDKALLPSEPIAVVDTDVANIRFDKPAVIWFGHSSFLIKTATANILVDPNFSGFAGPFKGSIKAFPGTNVYYAEDMPPIDVLIISHDHYDHLDYLTVKRLKKKLKRILVPMGVGSHFRHWGFDPAIITEVNWYDSVSINEQVSIVATPAHHRSNRTMKTRKTLWASYVIEADGYKMYYSGDTGYSPHFKDIGARYGPFDLALMECGQYNVQWPQSHMFPGQVAQASFDLKARMVMPVHWGMFAQSVHAWNEPVKRFLIAADSLGVKVSVPFIGQPYVVESVIERVEWWEFF